MAGSDQSVNLTGMLGQISNTLGSGYQINGKSAGEAMGDNLRNAFKPEVDNKDPNSYMNLAMWAERNGRPDEAKAYRDEAAELSVKLTKEAAIKQETDFVGKVRELEQKMATAQAEGNPIAFQQAQAELQAIEGVDLEQARFVQAAEGRAEGGLEKTQQTRTKKTATSLIEYQDRLADPDSEFQGSGKEVMEQWVENQLKDPEMRKEYNAQLEQVAKTETMKIDAKAQADLAAANGLMELYKNPQGGISKVLEEAKKLGTPEAMAVAKEISTFHETSVKLATAKTPAEKSAAYNSTLTAISGTIDNLTADLGEEATALYTHELERLQTEAAPGKSVYPGQVQKDIRSLMNSVGQLNIQRTATQLSENRSKEEKRKAADERIDMMEVSDSDVYSMEDKMVDLLKAHPSNHDGIPFNSADSDPLTRSMYEEMYRDEARFRSGGQPKHWQIDPETRSFILDDNGKPVPVEGSQTNVPPKQAAAASVQAAPATPNRGSQLQKLISAGLTREQAEAEMKKRNL